MNYCTLDNLLVNISGLTVEFAMVKPGHNQHIHSHKKYNAQEFATATDCFNHYAHEYDILMKGRTCAIAVSAAVSSDAIKIMRGNWTFSILGFSHMFGRKPIVINDTAALSWANLAGTDNSHKPLSFTGERNFNRVGKYLTIQLVGGVGISTLIVTHDKRHFVVDSEHAHAGFHPGNDRENHILNALRLGKYQVSWEDILCLSDSDPLWKKPEINLSLSEISDLKASLLGALAGDATLSQTTWNGVFLYGDCAHYLNTTDRIAMFQKRFEHKNNYRINLHNTPRWLVNMDNGCLLGCAAMLAHHHSEN